MWRNNLFGQIGRFSVAAVLVLAASVVWPQEPGSAAAPADPINAAIRDLQLELRALRTAVAEMRSEAAQSRAEAAELRRELQATRSLLVESSRAAVAAGEGQAGSLNERVSTLEESAELLSGKVDEQYQTKVESASKYRVRLSGIVLLNLFGNRGMVDSQDLPNYVPRSSSFDSNGALGATLRQSQLGLEVFGPRLAGARTSGTLQVDLAGGFPEVSNGVNFGLLRLRIADMRMDWERTSAVIGQDNLFFSPLSPTSFASLAVPAFGYQGNLWGWTPQVRLEHRFDFAGGQSLSVQGGVLDNVSGEPPYSQSGRLPQAGERSGLPAEALRVAWTRMFLGRPLVLGGAAYYGRQNWGFSRHVDAWAGMADWQVPLTRQIDFSGEFYRGRAAGGLGGGIGRSVLYSGSIFDPATQVRGLDSVGGWSQLKFKATSRLEFNGAFGLDNPMAEDVRAFPASQSYFDPRLVQNRSALVNFIYRPRSNLLFSTEYRHLRTFEIDSGSRSAEQMNVMMGILF
jgi:hypothetical protein